MRAQPKYFFENLFFNGIIRHHLETKFAEDMYPHLFGIACIPHVAFHVCKLRFPHIACIRCALDRARKYPFLNIVCNDCALDDACKRWLLHIVYIGRGLDCVRTCG